MENYINSVFWLAVIALLMVAVTAFFLIRTLNGDERGGRDGDSDEITGGKPDNSASADGNPPRRKGPAWANKPTFTDFDNQKKNRKEEKK